MATLEKLRKKSDSTDVTDYELEKLYLAEAIENVNEARVQFEVSVLFVPVFVMPRRTPRSWPSVSGPLRLYTISRRKPGCVVVTIYHVLPY